MPRLPEDLAAKIAARIRARQSHSKSVVAAELMRVPSRSPTPAEVLADRDRRINAPPKAFGDPVMPRWDSNRTPAPVDIHSISAINPRG